MPGFSLRDDIGGLGVKKKPPDPGFRGFDLSGRGVKKKPPDPVFHGFDLGGPGVNLIPRVAIDCGS